MGRSGLQRRRRQDLLGQSHLFGRQLAAASGLRAGRPCLQGTDLDEGQLNRAAVATLNLRLSRRELLLPLSSGWSRVQRAVVSWGESMLKRTLVVAFSAALVAAAFVAAPVDRARAEMATPKPKKDSAK